MNRKNIETELGKINFAYRKGDPLVVFLNGFGSFDTAQSFSKVIEALPNKYGYFASDYLNSGFSGKSLKDYTVSDEATKLAKIINDFNAKKVIILAHSIGGVYAMQMKYKINNLKAFVGIEPTTREIMLNPPKEPAYIEKNKNMAKLQEKIEADLREIFTPEENKKFWTTTEQNAKKFDEKDNLNAQAAYENDSFWKNTTRISDKTPSIVITEKYRENEYKRSEYTSNNPKSKVITLG
ncbi:alpha/beta hydrolase [Lactobacillus crispatus]